ncbi:hypothetical protein DFH07DRAFT_871011 [Mycena maculata]|uniref:Reverse transcriptase n=1 Tax=Mycena maculata TaxID=230809 RepID=A0AAD7I1U9_9AGAR|nr:hypothetical protein DFH07DRAFT_871011 [Mycena maculata]
MALIVGKAINKHCSTSKLPIWEREGWVGVPHRDVLRCLAAELNARNTSMFLRVAENGSPERMLRRQATILAKGAARTQPEARWDLTLPKGTALPGLSLQGNRQKVFYCSIREIKDKKLTQRKSTADKLKTVREAAEHIFGRHVSDADIWNTLASKDIFPRTAQFLWKGLHDVHRISKYWTHIPECEDRAIRQNCGTIEDLEHILVKCECPGQETIWKATKNLWLEKEAQWPEVNLGTILGCGLADFRDDKGRPKRGTQRLYRILMSDYRVISRGGALATKDEIINKWKFNINQRLQVDIGLENRPIKGRRPTLTSQLVLETWSGVLDDGHRLPANWLREPRVLVGNQASPQTQPHQQNSRGIG